MIKAIDTKYKNHLFRSRLEARFAIYFDELCTSWEYEQEGFELGNGVRYLPDFYLPQYEIYAEIKPKPFTHFEHTKCKRLANLTRKIVIELIGLPNVNPCNIIVPYTYYVCPDCGRKENFLIGQDVSHCSCNKKVKSINAVMENNAILLLHSDKPSYKPLYYTNYMDDYTNDKVIQNAIKKATEARFEFL
jgi:hypothetical protein